MAGSGYRQVVINLQIAAANADNFPNDTLPNLR